MKQGKIINSEYSECWYKDDLLHRDGDLPAIIQNNKNSYWYQNGKLHRLKNPACIEPFGWSTSTIKNPYRSWYKNALWHRLNAPAIIFPKGEERKNQYMEFGEFIK
jgi:hypothetical protein